MSNSIGRVKSFLVVLYCVCGFLGFFSHDGFAQADDENAASGWSPRQWSIWEVFVEDPDDRFFMTRPRLAIGLYHEYTNEKRNVPTVTGETIDTRDTSNEFRERFKIATDGWWYHPGLLKFRLSFEPEWIQRRTVHGAVGAVEEETVTSDAYLPAYLSEFSLFTVKPYTLTLFANRRQRTTTSSSANKTESESDQLGATLFLRSRIVPTNVRYVHQETEETGYFNTDSESDNVSLSVSNRIGSSYTRFLSSYDDSTTTSTGIGTTGVNFTTNLKTTNNNLRNSVDLADQGRVRLDTSLVFHDTETDTIETSTVRAVAGLGWKHRRNFRTDYRLQYDKRESGSFETDVKTARAGLLHELYENLTTVLSGEISNESFSGGSNDRYEGKLSLNYKRYIPIGTLNLSMGQDYSQTKRDRADIQVSEEILTLDTGSLNRLRNQGVDPNSVVVTGNVPGTGATEFESGVEYTVEPDGAFSRIIPIIGPGSRLTDGQVVTVSYRYTSPGSYDDSQRFQSYGAALNLWSFLRLSYRHSKISQKLTSDPLPSQGPFFLVNDTIDYALARLDFGWTDTSVSYEEATRSVSTSTRTWQALETITFVPSRETHVRLGGRYVDRELLLDEGNQTEEVLGATATLNWLVVPRCLLTLEGFWDELSSPTQETEEIGVKPQALFRYGVWSASATYEFVDQNDRITGQRFEKHTWLLEINRALW